MKLPKSPLGYYTAEQISQATGFIVEVTGVADTILSTRSIYYEIEEAYTPKVMSADITFDDVCRPEDVTSLILEVLTEEFHNVERIEAMNIVRIRVTRPWY
jgi:hypothetical protein